MKPKYVEDTSYKEWEELNTREFLVFLKYLAIFFVGVLLARLVG